ncbi:MAG: response regulator [Candidatus Thermoplasmatota archaeon]
MSKTVMVVDDQEDTIEMVETLLTSQGYDVETASNGIEALEKLESGDIKPDLILMDMFMPEMSGREVCEKIRDNKDLEDIKIAFFTVASFSEKGKEMLKDLDVSDYITKPFESRDLVRRIQKIIGE